MGAVHVDHNNGLIGDEEFIEIAGVFAEEERNFLKI
jgi:hypothetical protein